MTIEEIIEKLIIRDVKQLTFPFGPKQEEWLTSLEKHPERQLKGILGRKQNTGGYSACCLGEYGLIPNIS